MHSNWLRQTSQFFCPPCHLTKPIGPTSVQGTGTITMQPPPTAITFGPPTNCLAHHPPSLPTTKPKQFSSVASFDHNGFPFSDIPTYPLTSAIGPASPAGMQTLTSR